MIYLGRQVGCCEHLIMVHRSGEEEALLRPDNGVSLLHTHTRTHTRAHTQQMERKDASREGRQTHIPNACTAHSPIWKCTPAATEYICLNLKAGGILASPNHPTSSPTALHPIHPSTHLPPQPGHLRGPCSAHWVCCLKAPANFSPSRSLLSPALTNAR